MAAEERWYFTKEQLNNSPSRRCGIDAEKELSYRQQAANLIQDMGQRIKLTQLAINTAIVYMHRFYMHHPFCRFHRNSISPAALFLAAKVEEQPRKLEHVIKVAHHCLHQDSTPLDTQSETYLERAHELVINENILLQTLGFDVAIDHPHTHVVKCCQLVRATKDLAQTSYFMATNSLHMTTMCLQYKPTVVACVCIYIVCKWSNYEIQRSSEGAKDWFFYVDKGVTTELLGMLTNEFMTVINKCPNKLKKLMMSSGGNNNPDSFTRPYSISRSSLPSSGSSRSHESSQNKISSKANPPSSTHKMNLKEYTEKREKERRDKERSGVLDHRHSGHPPISSSSIQGHHMQHHNISAIGSSSSHGMAKPHGSIEQVASHRKVHGDHSSRGMNVHAQRSSNQSHSRPHPNDPSSNWFQNTERHDYRREMASRGEKERHDNNYSSENSTSKWIADRSNKHPNIPTNSSSSNSIISNRHSHTEAYLPHDNKELMKRTENKVEVKSEMMKVEPIKSEVNVKNEMKPCSVDSYKMENKYPSYVDNRIKNEPSSSHYKVKPEVKEEVNEDILSSNDIFGNDSTDFSLKDFLPLGTEPPDNIFDNTEETRNILGEDISAPVTHHKGVSPPPVPASMPLSLHPPSNHPQVPISNSTSSNSSRVYNQRNRGEPPSDDHNVALPDVALSHHTTSSSSNNRHSHHLVVNGTSSSSSANQSQVPDRTSSNSLNQSLAVPASNVNSNSSSSRDRSNRKSREPRISPNKLPTMSSSAAASHSSSRMTEAHTHSSSSSKLDTSHREELHSRLMPQSSSSSKPSLPSSLTTVTSSSLPGVFSMKNLSSSQSSGLDMNKVPQTLPPPTTTDQPQKLRLNPSSEHHTVDGNVTSGHCPNNQGAPNLLLNQPLHKKPKQHKHKEKKKRKNKDKDKEKDKEKHKDKEHKEKEHKEHKKDKKHKKNKDKDKEREKDKDKSKDKHKSNVHTTVPEEPPGSLKIKISRDKLSSTPDVGGSGSRSSSNMVVTTSHHTPLAAAAPSSHTTGSLKLTISKSRIKSDLTPNTSPMRNMPSKEAGTPSGVKLKIPKEQLKFDRDSRKREHDNSSSDRGHPAKIPRHSSPQVTDSRWTGQRH